MPLHQEEVATLESVKDYYGKVRARTRGTSGRGGGRGASGRGCAPLARAWPSRTHTHTHKQVLSTSKDLKTSACTAAGRPHPKILEIFKKIPTEVMEKFYGCGAPLPLGIDGLCPRPRLLWRAPRRRAALLCGAPRAPASTLTAVLRVRLVCRPVSARPGERLRARLLRCGGAGGREWARDRRRHDGGAAGNGAQAQRVLLQEPWVQSMQSRVRRGLH